MHNHQCGRQSIIDRVDMPSGYCSADRPIQSSRTERIHRKERRKYLRLFGHPIPHTDHPVHIPISLTTAEQTTVMVARRRPECPVSSYTNCLPYLIETKCHTCDRERCCTLRQSMRSNREMGIGSCTRLFSFGWLEIFIWLLLYVQTVLLPYHLVAGVAPKYETAYACEGKTLTIECATGDLINLIRANYGRFSITICNDHGNVDWSVNCMAPKSLRVLHSKCAHKQNCSVLASTNMFGDPCPGTHKYLEAHYQCISASHSLTTTTRPSPPWLITSQPSVWSTSTPRSPTTSRISNKDLPSGNHQSPPQTKAQFLPASPPPPNVGGTINGMGGQNFNLTIVPITGDDVGKTKHRLMTWTTTTTTTTTGKPSLTVITHSGDSVINRTVDLNVKPIIGTINPPRQPDDLMGGTKSQSDLVDPAQLQLYCGPQTKRSLFWNYTRAGLVNVQPCPGGATGIAKWRCVYLDVTYDLHDLPTDNRTEQLVGWQPKTPDLTQCRSLWLNTLENRVNQRDSPLVSIATDLSEVTNSKTLYGGDMLVTTKIIQVMSKKMTADIEMFPDQRQRENIVLELLNGVVRTGSNLLDQTQQLSWLDLSFADQMLVATSLLTGLEDNAFLVASTIVRERNVVQHVKNILLEVRVLETRNIVGNEVFPDVSIDRWDVSGDRIELPRGALIENSEGGLVKIVFVAFDRLESILRPPATEQTDNHGDQLDDIITSTVPANLTVGQPRKDGGQRGRILNSKVISASLGRGRHIQLSQPIRLTLKHLKVENVTNPACVYWNYVDHAWSEDGCFIDQTNRTHTTCMCNHLTNFAILMDVIETAGYGGSHIGHPFISIFDDDMRILIYISVTIAILFILVTLISLKLFTGVFQKSNRQTIYKNLYICLLIIEVTFLSAIVQTPDTPIVFCGCTTIILHCAYICAIAWIFFEAFQLNQTLVVEEILLDVEKTTIIYWYYFTAYGITFSIVAVSLIYDPVAYTHSDTCVWIIDGGQFYVSFVAPIILFAGASLIYCGWSVYAVCKKYKTSLKNKEHTRLASTRFYLRCSFILLCLVITCWTFAYAYMKSIRIDGQYRSANNLMGYLFVLSNGLLGAYIFGFHCAQNEKVRREYRKYVRQYTWLPKCIRCRTKSQPTINQNRPDSVPGVLPSGPNPPMIGITGSMLSGDGYETNLSRAGSHTKCGNKPYRHNVHVERSGILTQYGGPSSPSSSADSTHLIYTGGMGVRGVAPPSIATDYQQYWSNQRTIQAGSIEPEDGGQFFGYDTKLNRKFPVTQRYYHSIDHEIDKQIASTSTQPDRDRFYWTEKSKKPAKRPLCNNNNKNLMNLMNGFGPTNNKSGTMGRIYHNNKPDEQIIDPDPGIACYDDIERFVRYNSTGPVPGNYRNEIEPAFHFPGPPPDRWSNRHDYPDEPVYEEIGHANQRTSDDSDGCERFGEIMMGPDDEDDDSLTDERCSGQLDIGSSEHGTAQIRQSTRIPLMKQNVLQSSGYLDGSQAMDQCGHHQLVSSQIGRSLSAILDENNAVRSYLEPIQSPK